MRSGVYLVGKLLGYRTTEFTNRESGEVKQRHTAGIQLQEPDGYGGYNTSTQDIRIDDKTFNDGFKHMVEKFKQKSVMVLVRPREWAMDSGRTGIVYTFDENSVIEEIK